MVQDRHVVSIKAELKVMCALSNGVADDVRVPLAAQTTPFFYISFAYHIFVVS